MTFTEAVRELAEGRCDEISRKGMYVRLFMGCLRCAYKSYGKLSDTFNLQPEYYLADDWQLVGVKPQVEVVEVVRWYCPKEEQSWSNCQGLVPKCVMCGTELIKLTGTYQRPVRPKVKRRVRVGTARDFLTHNEPCPDHADLFAEWTEEADQ